MCLSNLIIKVLHLNINGINWANIIPVPVSSIRTDSQKETITHFATINCHSIVNKTADFKIDLHTQNVDICALTETWLKEDDAITPMEMCPAGYASLSVPQTDRLGGGLALVFRKDLDIMQGTVYKFSSMECIILLSSTDLLKEVFCNSQWTCLNTSR